MPRQVGIPAGQSIKDMQAHMPTHNMYYQIPIKRSNLATISHCVLHANTKNTALQLNKIRRLLIGSVSEFYTSQHDKVCAYTQIA